MAILLHNIHQYAHFSISAIARSHYSRNFNIKRLKLIIKQKTSKLGVFVTLSTQAMWVVYLVPNGLLAFQAESPILVVMFTPDSCMQHLSYIKHTTETLYAGKA